MGGFARIFLFIAYKWDLLQQDGIKKGRTILKGRTLL